MSNTAREGHELGARVRNPRRARSDHARGRRRHAGGGDSARWIRVVSAIQFKTGLGYDDSLDVFGIHGCAGIFGAIALTFGIRESWLAANADSSWTALQQMLVQVSAVGATLLYASVVTYVVVLFVDRTVGLRLGEGDQMAGMDHVLHSEHGYGLLNLN